MCKLSCLFVLIAAALAAAESTPIPLWPGTPPGEKGGLGPEKDTTKPTDGLVAGKPVIRLGPVSNPSMTLYRAPAAANTGATVVVFPGGGYSILAMDLEGTEVCQWLNTLGVNCALVKYRVPVRAGLPRYGPPLQDAQRAVGMVRHRATEWGLDAKRIGVLGFSAGGHLVAALSTNFDTRTYDAVDEADKVSCRPDFTLLIYPAYLTAKSDQGPPLAPELKVTANTPPSFLIQAEDDSVGVENSLVYYAALRTARVPAEAHLYPIGGHGYGLRSTQKPITGWPRLAEPWLRSLGVLSKTSHRFLRVASAVRSSFFASLIQDEVHRDRGGNFHGLAVQKRRLEDPLPYGVQRRIDQQRMAAQHFEFVNPPVGAEHAEQFHGAGNARLLGQRRVDRIDLVNRRGHAKLCDAGRF